MMKYRTIQKTGEKVSLLGFGAMRLPVVDGDIDNVDEAEAVRMIRKAIDKGVNYVDTAYVYHGGSSEVAVGKALKDGYREKVLIADKLPVWMVKAEDDIYRLFGTQLARLGANCIDMYLVHSLSAKSWKHAKKMNTLAHLEKLRADGKIRYIGFSFHDDFDTFREVLESYPWDFCQIQLNYMDADFQAGVKGLKLAASLGIPVVIMEPLKGGKLTDVLPPSIRSYWAQAPVQRTPAEWALRWVADFPEVLTILSGMSAMEQVEENIRILEEAEPNSLTEAEKEIIKTAADKYNKLIPYSCTACKYCLPCPAKIDIPNIIERYNDWHIYEGNEKIKQDFNLWVPVKGRPSVCKACRSCEKHCPQHLPVSEIMEKAKAVFEA